MSSQLHSSGLHLVGSADTGHSVQRNQITGHSRAASAVVHKTSTRGQGHITVRGNRSDSHVERTIGNRGRARRRSRTGDRQSIRLIQVNVAAHRGRNTDILVNRCVDRKRTRTADVAGSSQAQLSSRHGRVVVLIKDRTARRGNRQVPGTAGADRVHLDVTERSGDRTVVTGSTGSGHTHQMHVGIRKQGHITRAVRRDRCGQVTRTQAVKEHTHRGRVRRIDARSVDLKRTVNTTGRNTNPIDRAQRHRTAADVKARAVVNIGDRRRRRCDVHNRLVTTENIRQRNVAIRVDVDRTGTRVTDLCITGLRERTRTRGRVTDISLDRDQRIAAGLDQTTGSLRDALTSSQADVALFTQNRHVSVDRQRVVVTTILSSGQRNRAVTNGPNITGNGQRTQSNHSNVPTGRGNGPVQLECAGIRHVDVPVSGRGQEAALVRHRIDNRGSSTDLISSLDHDRISRDLGRVRNVKSCNTAGTEDRHVVGRSIQGVDRDVTNTGCTQRDVTIRAGSNDGRSHRAASNNADVTGVTQNAVKRHTVNFSDNDVARSARSHVQGRRTRVNIKSTGTTDRAAGVKVDVVSADNRRLDSVVNDRSKRINNNVVSTGDRAKRDRTSSGRVKQNILGRTTGARRINGQRTAVNADVDRTANGRGTRNGQSTAAGLVERDRLVTTGTGSTESGTNSSSKIVVKVDQTAGPKRVSTDRRSSQVKRIRSTRSTDRGDRIKINRTGSQLSTRVVIGPHDRSGTADTNRVVVSRR